MVSLGSAFNRAHFYASKYEKIWHVVEYPGGLGAPVGSGYISDGDHRPTLEAAALARFNKNHAGPKFVALCAVYPDGSRLETGSP